MPALKWPAFAICQPTPGGLENAAVVRSGIGGQMTLQVATGARSATKDGTRREIGGSFFVRSTGLLPARPTRCRWQERIISKVAFMADLKRVLVASAAVLLAGPVSASSAAPNRESFTRATQPVAATARTVRDSRRVSGSVQNSGRQRDRSQFQNAEMKSLAAPPIASMTATPSAAAVWSISQRPPAGGTCLRAGGNNAREPL